jgi:hypothetical protein
VTEERPLRDVLGARVSVRGELVGHVSGVLLDGSESRAIGLEITSAGLRRRFLPWVVATFGDEGIDALSAFLLIDSCEPYLDQGAVLCREPERLDEVPPREVSTIGLVGSEIK